MTFRTRLALASAIAVAAAIAVASLVSYGLVRAQLRGSIDDALRARARQVQVPVGGPLGEFGLPDPLLGGAGGYAQLVTASGGVFRRPDAKIPLPSEGARQVAAGTRDPYFEDATVADTRVRILTAKYADGSRTICPASAGASPSSPASGTSSARVVFRSAAACR